MAKTRPLDARELFADRRFQTFDGVRQASARDAKLREAAEVSRRDELISANPIADFVRDRGHELKRAGENFVTSGCPVTQHKRGHRPVMIYPKTQSWSCHDCKIGGSVIDWLAKEKGISGANAMQELSGDRNGSEPTARLVKTYDYTDEIGQVLYQVCRYDPKDFKQRRPDGCGDWIWSTVNVRRVLYRLPDVIAAQMVIVTEGEKDSDNLTELGFVATCNCGGAKKWRDSYSEILRDKDVVIIGDTDDDGREHVEQVIESLTGVARSIKRVTLPHGFKDVSDYVASLPPETAAQAIKELIEATPEVLSSTSFLSCGRSNSDDEVDDFPSPVSDIVFHGLAGDIVRRIEPHTEADSVGLLVQTLTAYGNVIGRNPHAFADGSRHSMNLFVVVVGETSKARKGTSWAHVQRTFKRADEQWAQDCIASGLSSGEGVIWAVRDPITKTVKDKKSGEQKPEVVDSGVADKRLCVVEGEFANVLKVMGREGNTLSPVIRSAFDTGALRSMTKNSEARATGAHVSIIGHITRDELRRLLTESESANGFGNRFLWLAVCRSKCLPEGGSIDSENLNDLVVRLHKAIEFARNAGEVTRDARARDLWAIVYPKLSEGKPGLLGAITARAEAQVLRLSCIYALLDCSITINVDHHRAALALWNYCEASAKWIFETATGDSRADRILQALRTMGREGLTRTDISHGLFQRNIKPAALDSALRTLVAIGKARPTKLPTGGRKAERWVATS